MKILITIALTMLVAMTQAQERGGYGERQVTIAGTVTITEGDTVSIYIAGLTTAGVAHVSYNDNAFITPDTLAQWWIPAADTLRVRGKFNKVVGYSIEKK